MWNKMDVKWEPNRKICFLYSDGSGAVLVQSTDDSEFIDDSGDVGELNLSDFGEWSYLPADFQLWHERDEDDAVAPLDPELTAI